MSWITYLIVGLIGLVAVALLGVAALIFWPRGHPFRDRGRTAEAYRAMEIGNGVVFDQTYPFTPVQFGIGDGGRIAARLFGPEEAVTLIVLVHGIGAAGARWSNPAGRLSAATGAQVMVVDLRGHGQSSGRRYDLDRIGQYEDDLAEVIGALRTERPQARIILAGHSMGGGIALRYALKVERPRVAGYLLFAPVFGPGPTAPRSVPEESVLRIDRARMTGLILSNLLGLRAFNHLPVAYLNAPPEFLAYSFMAMASALPLPPRTAADGLAAMEGRFLILAGAEDQAVHAEGYREVAAPLARGRVEILPRLGHDSLLNAPETHALVAEWLAEG